MNNGNKLERFDCFGIIVKVERLLLHATQDIPKRSHRWIW